MTVNDWTVRAMVVLFVKLPEVPVMVTVAAPAVAVLLAVSVKVLVAVAGLGLKEALTPLGKPDADKLTLPLKPFWGVSEIVLEPLAPCVTVKLLGEAESVKLGAGTEFTVRAMVVLFVKLPEVPVMVTVAAPAVAVLLAVSVKVLVAVAGLGLKEAVTPLGKPDADKLTLPLKPFWGVSEIVLEPLAPSMRVRLLGEVESVKFGAGVEEALSEMLSKVAVARAELLPLFAAKPT